MSEIFLQEVNFSIISQLNTIFILFNRSQEWEIEGKVHVLPFKPVERSYAVWSGIYCKLSLVKYHIKGGKRRRKTKRKKQFAGI